MLAYRVRQLQSSNLIPSVFDNNSRLITNKKEINDVFARFHQELYTSNWLVEEQKMSDFFASIKSPCLSNDQRNLLETEIINQS